MNGFKPDPDVKADHDAITPSGSGYMDDDFYEDTGELSLPIKGAERDLWLTRVPDWLYEKISNWDNLADGNDDDQIVLGEVLAFPDANEKDGISKTQPMRIFFDERWKQKSQLPTAFELEPQSAKGQMLKNTYIFTEKDLPGYKHSGVGQNRYGNAGHGSFGGVQDPKARIQKRSKYKKAIPKQTTLVGNATRQYLAQPLSTREFITFDAARHKQAIQGSNLKTNIVNHMNELNEMSQAQDKFGTFIRPTAPRKSQLNKAARIPRNELIDLLHRCFDRYQYWPMKTLKQETRQPEAYLKEVLTDIAILVKSGPFASNWARSGNYGTAKAELAPEMDDDSGEDDDEMEDVVRKTLEELDAAKRKRTRRKTVILDDAEAQNLMSSQRVFGDTDPKEKGTYSERNIKAAKSLNGEGSEAGGQRSQPECSWSGSFRPCNSDMHVPDWY